MCQNTKKCIHGIWHLCFRVIKSNCCIFYKSTWLYSECRLNWTLHLDRTPNWCIRWYDFNKGNEINKRSITNLMDAIYVKSYNFNSIFKNWICSIQMRRHLGFLVSFIWPDSAHSNWQLWIKKSAFMLTKSIFQYFGEASNKCCIWAVIWACEMLCISWKHCENCHVQMIKTFASTGSKKIRL